MNLPWVSRERYNIIWELRNAEKARYEELLERAVTQAEFWRDKYEKEQARADRAVDSLVVAAGHQPISEESRTETAKISDASVEMSKQITEIFGDVENSVAIDPSTQESEVEAVEPTKEQIEADRNARLETIRARIEARKLAEIAQNTSTEAIASA